MLYRVIYADGSVEIIPAGNIEEAREAAEELYDEAPVRRIVAMDAAEPDLTDEVDGEEDAGGEEEEGGEEDGDGDEYGAAD
ncbi:MAG: hypothetical protein N3A38_13380 [Planctomycetota bacterium]|nr:hypothetical protein [Planctomycetota bacterium]